MSPELDPRIERSRRLIAEATIAEMADVGYGAMTVEAIAKRAGVSKATIYRQWPGKLAIVESALDELKSDMRIDETASPRSRLTQLLTWLATYIGDLDNPSSACVPAMVSAAQYDPAVREFHHRFSADRRQVLIGIIEDGRRTGDFDTDLDPALTAELLVGPIFYRRFMTPTPFPADEIEAVVDAVLGPG
jgi:TetR/AcrR family transcriptional regulator of autoinduction and epiphytic fitness